MALHTNLRPTGIPNLGCGENETLFSAKGSIMICELALRHSGSRVSPLSSQTALLCSGE